MNGSFARLSRRDFLVLADGHGPARALPVDPLSAFRSRRGSRPRPGLPDRLQRLPAHRRGRPRHLLRRQGRAGPGVDDVARAAAAPRSSTSPSTRWTSSWATPTSARGTWARSDRSASGSSARCCAPRRPRRGPSCCSWPPSGCRCRWTARSRRTGSSATPATRPSASRYGQLVAGQAHRAAPREGPRRSRSRRSPSSARPPRARTRSRRSPARRSTPATSCRPGTLHARICGRRRTARRSRRSTPPRPRRSPASASSGTATWSPCCTSIATRPTRRSRSSRRSSMSPRPPWTTRRSSTTSSRPPRRVGWSPRAATCRRARSSPPSIFEETYLNSYVAHAAVETHSAVAEIEDGKVTVWARTQTPFPVKAQVAEGAGLSRRRTCASSRRTSAAASAARRASRQAVEAARLAMITGKPVQVVWDRDEEFFYDTFRPAAVVKIQLGPLERREDLPLGLQGLLRGRPRGEALLRHPAPAHVSAGGWQGRQPPGLHPFGVGPWRAPSANTNTFARESHIDIMAAKAGVDPVEFRLNNLTDQRMLRVLKAAAKQFGWTPKRAPSGRGVGVALRHRRSAPTWRHGRGRGGQDAPAASRSSASCCAQDMGVIVNPEGSRQQMEGCITMGLGYALTEEVRFKDGEVLDRNFDTYEIPRFSWLPKIETVLIENPGRARAGRRRAGDRRHGRGGGQRDLRRRGRAVRAAADDAGAHQGGAQGVAAARSEALTARRRTPAPAPRTPLGCPRT